MTPRLTTEYAKNYCNRTLIVKVIVENVVTCFLLGHSVYGLAVGTADSGTAIGIFEIGTAKERFAVLCFGRNAEYCLDSLKFVQLIMRKIIKIVAARCQI